jgi:A/G-specific adenine glycosylase
VFIRKLLAWYRRNARKLPWRGTRNPYAILVSEFMLQQTQVSRVLQYYPRFLKRFPTAEKLAKAQPRAVRAAWEGMGYYARARNLHSLVREIADTGYRIPDSPETLRTLPGVGPYTAGAVACFAYEKPVPAVDTNVKRVLTRFFGRETCNGDRATWDLAAEIVPRKGKTAWAFNQAVMELGALVCTARKPKCPACPVRRECRSPEKRAGHQRQQGQDTGERREDRLAAP